MCFETERAIAFTFLNLYPNAPWRSNMSGPIGITARHNAMSLGAPANHCGGYGMVHIHYDDITHHNPPPTNKAITPRTSNAIAITVYKAL